MIETVINDRRSSLFGEKNMSHFPFRGSPNAQNSVSSAPSSPPLSIQQSNSTTMAVTTTTTVLPGARSTSPYSTSGSISGSTQQQTTQSSQRCCETGRPVYTDQVTGQSICSCQMEILNSRLANAAGITGPGGMPLSMYNPYGEPIPYFPGVGGEQLAFYPNMAPGLDLKENMAGGVPWPYPPMYYESALGSYPFNPYGMELNGARRKNATRETTSMLKAWLNEHKKNPYPTKGEKIMLAVITKMTLTQVSTWFANARRRLKKENKMTWEPRNRVDDDDATIDDDDQKSNDGKDLLDSKDSGTGSSEDGDRPSHHRLDILDHHHHHHLPPSSLDLKNDWHEVRPNSPDICDRPRPPHPLLHPAALHHLRPMTGLSPDTKHTAGASTNSNDVNKPRIWSLADMAKKENKEGDTQPSQSGMYNSGPGKIISPLAGRYPIHPSPYVKPEFYRSLYSPNPAHLTGNPHDHQALLESYQFFGSSLAHNRLAAMNPLTMKTKPPHGSNPLTHPLAPLSLPPHSSSTTPPSGISPSASSTASSGPEITSPSHNHHNNDKNSSPISVTRP